MRTRRIGITAFVLLLLFWLAPWHQLVDAQTQHGIQWTWSAVTQDTTGNAITVDGYNIYCAPSATGPFTTKTNSALISGTSYLETGLTAGNTYSCQITAVKGTLESVHSATGSAVFQFPPVAPGTPAGVSQ